VRAGDGCSMGSVSAVNTVRSCRRTFAIGCDIMSTTEPRHRGGSNPPQQKTGAQLITINNIGPARSTPPSGCNRQPSSSYVRRTTSAPYARSRRRTEKCAQAVSW
jgi:hypothetical protein